MAAKKQIWCILVMCLAAVAAGGRQVAQERGSACSPELKTLKFLSPPLTAKPGEANNKFFPAQYPEGHIGIKSFFAELVDEHRMPIPLSEVYLHHFIVMEYAVPTEDSQTHLSHLLNHMRAHHKHHIYPDLVTPLDPFQRVTLADGRQTLRLNFLGKGGETRHTQTRIPGPYALESGVKMDGYETVWTLNVHALDTRGAANKRGCTECRCNLYNATTDDGGEPLPEGYFGGLRCCGDGRQCAVEEGYDGGEHTIYLEYTWEYVDWSECLVQVSTVAIDITNADGLGENLVEFNVEGSCGDADPSSEECVDTRVATLLSPLGGELVYTVSHLHSAAIDASLWGEDGRLICRTTPMYGQGEEAGNEKNYVVGVQHCYGNPGTANAARIERGEKLKYVVKSTKVDGPHTGLMAIIGSRIAADSDSAASGGAIMAS